MFIITESKMVSVTIGPSSSSLISWRQRKPRNQPATRIVNTRSTLNANSQTCHPGRASEKATRVPHFRGLPHEGDSGKCSNFFFPRPPPRIRRAKHAGDPALQGGGSACWLPWQLLARTTGVSWSVRDSRRAATISSGHCLPGWEG